MDSLVDEVDLLQANPHYAHVRYPDGRETTVSTRSLAPRGQKTAEIVTRKAVGVPSSKSPPAEAPQSAKSPPAEALQFDDGSMEGLKKVNRSR